MAGPFLSARAPLVLLLSALAACGSGAERALRAAEPAAPTPAPPPVRSPEFAEARAALEAGQGKLALGLLAHASGFEATCLRARAHLQVGQAVESLADIESARALAPENAELFATEAEILASLDRIPGAADVLTKGVKRVGVDAALLRAQGVIELRNPGHAEAALEALERARARDPELPFLRWPLAQAHLLVGRAKVDRSPGEAVAHARAARGLVPDLLDALELEAEAEAACLHFEQALALYAELAQAGRDAGDAPARLHQKCATRCLLERDRPRALEHYAAARALGLDDQELGFGAELLREERDAAVERGNAAVESEDWDAAEHAFARALELAPGDLQAEELLGLTRFRRADFRGAAAAWEHVLARAEATRAELDEPVPIHLAKAWRLAGERERARETLARTLDHDPRGPWSDSARELLLVLEAEELSENEPGK